MPIKLSGNERIKSASDTYTVDAVLNQGAFAHAAKAKSTARGRVVFLKRYFAPTPTIPWYRGFVEHQQELKKRISTSPALRQYCYEFIDFFEGTEGRAKRTFHQVFEFIENGKPLKDFIEEFNSEAPGSRWEQRVTFARVMMMGIAALHARQIVHTDLKPDNLFLTPNPHSAGAFHLKIIDLDWAIFSDRRAPWHGDPSTGGYVGTPLYFSPEHGGKATIPNEKSDIFTCGLMLAELLAGGHPFAKSVDYGADIKSGRFERFRLVQPIPKVGSPAFVEEMVNRALDPDADRRPTAVQLRDALLGQGEAGQTKSPPPPPPKKAEVPPPPKSPSLSRVELLSGGNVVLAMQIDTAVGRPMLKAAGDDARFVSDPQFRIHRDAEKSWCISPVGGTHNETIVNGKPLTSLVRLSNGMRISVGNAAKGIEKLPLTVRLV